MAHDTGLGRDRGSRRQQLSEDVASYVRELIVSGAARPGEFLRMEPIAEAVGVSNTPAREGLLSLRGEGFVRLVPRRGFVVAPFSRQDVHDLFWSQAQLAGELAARAAKNITAARLDRLAALVEQYSASITNDDEAGLVELGHTFHREINFAAESDRLALLLGSVVKQLPNRFYAAIEGKISSAHDEHPLILEALRNRKSQRARALMEQHVLESADHLIEMLDARGLWSEDRSAS
ncbi:GntR family transcriptional regulator [Saccharopolyspora sp. TS4A08]|uniref:GntR family transcriptional regulator n=1 Tax=Saccharopolyspora ipomoeae TaxID=3042027 RepID=A0ABT6PUU6_9PSEU|nr:GntR family transcriptional regulator [Saccharopolyspora sp. TS4A08]MDI2031787.1 GntR family transcriptional regulator [Saccharopolyspora sp. TS4A08]